MGYTINGESFIHASTALIEVLASWGAQQPYAVAVNQEFVTKAELENKTLKVGDEIDVLSPIQGG